MKKLWRDERMREFESLRESESERKREMREVFVERKKRKVMENVKI